MIVSDKDIIETRELYEQLGSVKAVAKRMGLHRSTVERRLKAATYRGLSGYNIDGRMPPGFNLKGVSTLYNAQGDVTAQWVLARKEQETYEDIENAILDSFKGYKGTSQLIKPPINTLDDLATIYIVSDHHLGLYAWEPEAGADYDVTIAEKVLKESMGELVASTPRSRKAVVLNLGDFFHSDNDEQRTRRSGNKLDVDTRYARVLQVGVDLMIWTIEYALQKHDEVLVRNIPGNHDPYATLALSVALKAFFANNPRVTVEPANSPFFWWTFGKVFVGSTHGDMIKHTLMPGVMASMKPKEWGNAEHRYIYLGHVHHQSIGGGESAGVVWETFRTLAAKDAWHRASGYASGRSMVAITHHKETGEKYRHTVTYEGPK